MSDPRVPIILTDEVAEEISQLSPHQLEALTKFLDKLQLNPYEPGLRKSAHMDAEEHFGYQFAPGYVVYWSITYPGRRSSTPQPLRLDRFAPDMKILLTAVQPKS